MWQQNPCNEISIGLPQVCVLGMDHEGMVVVYQEGTVTPYKVQLKDDVRVMDLVGPPTYNAKNWTRSLSPQVSSIGIREIEEHGVAILTMYGKAWGQEWDNHLAEIIIGAV